MTALACIAAAVLVAAYYAHAIGIIERDESL